MTAMNPHAAVTRDEFERTIEELRAEMKSSSSHSAATDRASPKRPREAFVLKDEFRLFKWFGGLALAAVLSGMGLLYQGLAKQRTAMERQFADLRAEMHAGLRAVAAGVDSGLDQMDSRITALQQDVADVKERLARVEALLDVKNRERLPD